MEAAYVGNRGVWWSAPVLATQNYNALQPELLKSMWGLDITNPADRALLTTPISSPQVTARFPFLKNPDNVYPGFPSSQPLKQALRPYPQWGGVPPFLGPPLGNTWYDSLQMKVTQRFSHGLTLQASYTFSKELTNGANSDTSYLTPNPPLINDVFNHAQNKQLSPFGHPHVFIVSFNYTTPKIESSGTGMKILSAAVHDWVFGGVLKYQSGTMIRVPGSNNGLLTQLDRGPENNPATWGGGRTFFNRVPGQPFLLKDPNCHCIDPTKDLVLNPNAWADVPAGQFGTSAPYYNNYRWQRQPSEALSIGRNFRIAGENKVILNVRAEFQNVFNRLFLALPSVGGPFNVNPLTPPTKYSAGQLSGGYGYVNWVNGGNVATPFPNEATIGARPRTGQIVARLTF